jgi:hypothetical protein
MSKIDKDTLITSDVPTSSVSVNLPGRVIRMATTLDLLFVLAAVLAFSFGWGPLLGLPTVPTVVAAALLWLGIEVVAQWLGLRVSVARWWRLWWHTDPSRSYRLPSPARWWHRMELYSARALASMAACDSLDSLVPSTAHLATAAPEPVLEASGIASSYSPCSPHRRLGGIRSTQPSARLRLPPSLRLAAGTLLVYQLYKRHTLLHPSAARLNVGTQ